MRFLITAHAALGHLRPLIGVAQALEAAGHTTVTATDNVARDDLAAAGLPLRALPPTDGFRASQTTGSCNLRPCCRRLNGRPLRFATSWVEPWRGRLPSWS